MNKLIIDKENIVTLKENTYELELLREEVTLYIEGKVIIKEIAKKEENLKLTIILKENAHLLYNRFICYERANTIIKLEQDNNTEALLNYSFLANGNCFIKIDSFIKGNHNYTEIKTKVVTQQRGKAVIEATAEVSKNTKDNYLLEDINIFVDNDEESTIIPNLLVSSNEVEVNHAATIGGINKEDLFYLSTKGITNKNAVQLIKNGFLIGNLVIDEQEKEKIKELIGGE